MEKHKFFLKPKKHHNTQKLIPGIWLHSTKRRDKPSISWDSSPTNSHRTSNPRLTCMGPTRKGFLLQLPPLQNHTPKKNYKKKKNLQPWSLSSRSFSSSRVFPLLRFFLRWFGFSFAHNQRISIFDSSNKNENQQGKRRENSKETPGRKSLVVKRQRPFSGRVETVRPWSLRALCKASMAGFASTD